MIYPEKYIKRETMELHSGGTTDIFYEVNALITDDYYRDFILKNLPRAAHYVGIATGGAVIAAIACERYRVGFSMVKDREIKGKMPLGDWVLIDDVVTTGNSLLEALKLFNTKPKEIFAVVDRRKEKGKLNISSLFKI